MQNKLKAREWLKRENANARIIFWYWNNLTDKMLQPEKIRAKVYWNLYDTYLKASNNKILNYEEAKYELSKVLEYTIQKRMIC